MRGKRVAPNDNALPLATSLSPVPRAVIAMPIGETTIANRSAKSDDVRKGNIIAAKGERGASAACAALLWDGRGARGLLTA